MAIASAISSSSSSVCASNFPKSTAILSSFPSIKSSSNHISFKSNNKTFTHCLSKSLTNLPRCANKSDGSVTASESLPIEKRIQAFPTVLNIDEIREILPHRFPFLLVDRVVELNPGVSAVAIKNVTINDNFFPGHFPERPIMPGVLMVEAMAQTGGIVLLKSDIGEDIGGEFFFAGVDKIRFRKPVIAGDTLVMRMQLVKLQKQYGIAKLEGKAFVDGNVVCEGEFMLAFSRPSKSKPQ